MKLIVGLGNPGARYRGTRHNVGFVVLDQLAAHLGVALDREKHQGRFAEGAHAGERVLLVQPQTYMNRSGDCVAQLARNKAPHLGDIAVVVDDIHLPLGRLRIREGGSAGGHNGLKSLIERLGGDGFVRVRMGVGNKAAGQDLAEHVLARFRPEEQADVDDMVERALAACLLWVEQGTEAAMNAYNRAGRRAEGT